MTPADARAMYRRMIAENCNAITLRRVGSPDQDFSIRARVTGFAADELVGDIEQGDRKVILLAEDVETAGFPLPFNTGGSDRIILPDGTPLNIQTVDDQTRRIAGVPIAYEIVARGS